MAVDERLRQQFIDLTRQREPLRSEAMPLHGGGGGGTSGGMERIDRLEKQTEQLVKDVGDLRVSMATLTERVAHLPTKDELGTKLRAYLTIVVAIVGVMIAAATLVLRATGK